MSNIDLKLAKKEQLAQRFDCASIFFLSIATLIASFSIYRSDLLSKNPFIDAFILLGFGDAFALAISSGLISFAIAGTLSLEICKILHRYLKHRWFPQYYIDVQKDVLRVVGSYGLGDGEVEFLKRKLLHMRPGYRIEYDAYKLFGCTLAAVPASETFKKARQEARVDQQAHGVNLY